jgi:hypothetical protein
VNSIFLCQTQKAKKEDKEEKRKMNKKRRRRRKIEGCFINSRSLAYYKKKGKRLKTCCGFKLVGRSQHQREI